MSSDRLAWRHRFFVPAVVLLLLIYGLEMFLSARLESQTFDEPAHLYAGYGYWLRGDFGINPEHPPLVKLVASLPLALVDKPAYPAPGSRFFRAESARDGARLLDTPAGSALLNHARIAVSLFAFLLALLVTAAAREMFGEAAALFALTLFVFDPLMVAHGPLVGTDVGATCCIFGTVYAFYRCVKVLSPARLAVCAVAAGLALAAKHSAILILPILILLAAIEVVTNRRAAAEGTNPLAAQSRGFRTVRLAVSLAVIAAVSLTILWAFYGFRYAARPEGAQITPPTAAFLQGLHHAAEAKAIGFAERRHLLPESYLYGLTDVTTLSRDGRIMFLFGRLYPQGRWFYFPAAFLVKSTIGFLLLLLLMPFSKALWRSDTRREVLFLVIPAGLYFGFAMTSKLDIGVRHVMPVMPFLIVLAAAGAVGLARQSRAWAWVVSLLLAMHVASSLHAFPNYLPYSNEFFGGPGRTYRVLSDSNAGWGGGLKALHAELTQRHITECWLAYEAPPDPATFGIPCKRLPTFFSMAFDTGQQKPVPEEIEGPVFISSQEPVDSFLGPGPLDPYQQFAALEPDRVIAGEILEFDGRFAVNPVASLSHSMVVGGLLRSGKVNEAVAEAEQAVALDPNSIRAHMTLASAYAAGHQPDKATREYDAATQVFGSLPAEFADTIGKPVNPVGPARP